MRQSLPACMRAACRMLHNACISRESAVSHWLVLMNWFTAPAVLQTPEPHSDSRALPVNVNWTLNNTALWEAVLEEHQTRCAGLATTACACCNAAVSSGSMSSATVSAHAAAASGLWLDAHAGRLHATCSATWHQRVCSNMMALDVHCRPTRSDAAPEGRGGSNLAATASRAGVTASMINGSSSMAASSMLGGRPHTPTQSTMNLQRTATSATIGLMPGNGGIATQLSRVGSKMQLGGTTAGAGVLTRLVRWRFSLASIFQRSLHCHICHVQAATIVGPGTRLVVR